MKLLTSMLTVGGLLAACTTNSLAATEGPLSATGVTYTLTDWANSIVFPQFDPSLGTLDSVELQLSSSLETTLTIDNTGDSPSAGSAYTEVQVTVQDGGLNLIAPFNVESASYGWSGLGGGDSITSGTLTGTGGSDEIYTSSAVLTEFTEGSGDISLNASTFTTTWEDYSGGNTSAGQVTDANLTGDVIYTYTAVPEPATMALAGFGGLSLLMFRRLRK